MCAAFEKQQVNSVNFYVYIVIFRFPVQVFRYLIDHEARINYVSVQLTGKEKASPT